MSIYNQQDTKNEWLNNYANSYTKNLLLLIVNIYHIFIFIQLWLLQFSFYSACWDMLPAKK